VSKSIQTGYNYLVSTDNEKTKDVINLTEDRIEWSGCLCVL